MKYLTFKIQCSIRCEDGSMWSWTFEEGAWVMADADRTVVDGEIVYYTPLECMQRAYYTFLSGLTESERQAGKLEIIAEQLREPA